MATASVPARASRPQIDAFLAEKRLAVIGVSRNPKDFTRTLFDELAGRGYDVVPVNPGAPEIGGRRCFARVQEIEPPVGAALLLTSPQVTEQAVRDCDEAGVRQVWMYRGAGAGAVSRPAVAYCRERGISVVPGECPFMFLPGAAWPHRLHGFVRRILGSYPQ